MFDIPNISLILMISKQYVDYIIIYKVNIDLIFYFQSLFSVYLSTYLSESESGVAFALRLNGFKRSSMSPIAKSFSALPYDHVIVSLNPHKSSSEFDI